MKKSVSASTKNLIWGMAAGRCAFSDCNLKCISHEERNNSKPLCQVAHICALGKKGARFNKALSKDIVNSPENLLLLCSHHHTLIDKEKNIYTVDKLKKIKEDHENWVIQKLKKSTTDINFLELEMTIQSIIQSPNVSYEKIDTQLTKLQTKIDINQLGKKTKERITMGLLKVKEVEDFLESILPRIPDFADKLKHTLANKYKYLVDEKITGDDLFNEMQGFCSSYSHNFNQMSAGLAILVYFFEKCEVFEK